MHQPQRVNSRRIEADEVVAFGADSGSFRGFARGERPFVGIARQTLDAGLFTRSKNARRKA